MNWILIANTNSTEAINLIWSLRVFGALFFIGLLFYHLWTRSDKDGA